jgi:hypothetical protein
LRTGQRRVGIPAASGHVVLVPGGGVIGRGKGTARHIGLAPTVRRLLIKLADQRKWEVAFRIMEGKMLQVGWRVNGSDKAMLVAGQKRKFRIKAQARLAAINESEALSRNPNSHRCSCRLVLVCRNHKTTTGSRVEIGLGVTCRWKWPCLLFLRQRNWGQGRPVMAAFATTSHCVL